MLDLSAYTVFVHQRALETVRACSADAKPHEAGGILLGYRQTDGIVITHAITVEPAIPYTVRYTRDDVRANAELTEYLSSLEVNDPTGYVGEWHSHPRPSGISQIDVRAIRSIARQTIAPIALLVFSPVDTKMMGAVAARARFGRILFREVSVVIEAIELRDLGPLAAGAVNPDRPIFISYRQSDGTDRADTFESLLRAAGLVVWRDRIDLRASTTTDRLEHALTGGLSGGVLIVTPDIADSSIVRNRELPRLLQLDDDDRFSLCIANEIPHPDHPDRPDYRAPDELLGLAPASTLAEKKQSNSRTVAGRLDIVRDLLHHRIALRKPQITSNGRTLTLTTQTRPQPTAADANESDLQIRLPPGTVGRLPSLPGLHDLQLTLPLTADAIAASTATTVAISGGMHLSVAFAIGAALPATRIRTVEVTDLHGSTWSSNPAPDDPHLHTAAPEPIDIGVQPATSVPQRIAVFVSLTDAADVSAFRRLFAHHPGVFAGAVGIAVDQTTPIDSREAARLSSEIARIIRDLASSTGGRAEVHLAYHGPFTLAVLIGRMLNTLRTVVYEWDNPETDQPAYNPAITIEPGVIGGPITHVHG